MNIIDEIDILFNKLSQSSSSYDDEQNAIFINTLYGTIIECLKPSPLYHISNHEISIIDNSNNEQTHYFPQNAYLFFKAYDIFKLYYRPLNLSKYIFQIHPNFELLDEFINIHKHSYDIIEKFAILHTFGNVLQDALD